MADVSPFHSVKQTVHHDEDTCSDGKNIEPENLRAGTGDKPLCSTCASL